MATESVNTIRPLSADECWQRLAQHPTRVGHVGIGGPAPDIVPVNYAVDGRSIVFRTAEGKKLTAIGRLERIVFQVDDVDATWRWAWSVVLRGFAEHVTAADEVAKLKELPLRPWDPTPKPEYVRITTNQVAGREIT